jgi:hypothetical protein
VIAQGSTAPGSLHGRGTRAAAAVAGWAIAFWLPWQPALGATPGLRSALGLALFCVPGFALAALLHRRRGLDLALHAPFALVYSVALTGALGFAGSVAELPTLLVRVGLWSAGAIALARLALAAPSPARARPSLASTTLLEGAALGAVMLIAARLCFSPVMGADDMTYVARITWFQQTPELSFRGIVFGGDQVISPRDWLAFWPLCEALIATLAGVHGLQLTTVYLGPLLAPLATLAVYGLARALGLSRRAAVTSTALQVLVLLLLYTRDQPGRHFFLRLTEDKFLALYVIAPVLLQLATSVLGGAHARALVALALGWLAIALVHPTALGIVFLVTGAYCALELLLARNARALVVLAIALPITAAAASVRFIPTTSLHPAYFGVEEALQANAMRGARERRVDVGDGGFYGISTRSAPPVARAAGALVLALALWRARRDRLARYVAAGFGLAALAIVPYSGWLLGKLLTPFHLWRVLAAVPYGIGATFALRLLYRRLSTLDAADGRIALGVRRAAALAPLLAIVLLSATVAYAAANPKTFRLTSLGIPDGWDRRLDARVKFDRSRPRLELADLFAIGDALDASIDERAVVLGEPEVNSLLPSLSAKAVLVAFRSPAQTSLHSGMPVEDARLEWREYQRLMLGKLAPDAAAAYLRKRNVRFVVTATDAAWLAAVPEAALPRRELLRAGDLALIEIVRDSGGLLAGP